jgi:hypothetical protein
MFELRIVNSATFFQVRIMVAMIFAGESQGSLNRKKVKSKAIPVTSRGGL